MHLTALPGVALPCRAAQIEALDFRPGGLVYDTCEHLPFSLPPGRLERGGKGQDRQSRPKLGEAQTCRPGGQAAEWFGRGAATTYVGPVFAQYGGASMINGFARPGQAKHRSRASGYCL